MSEKISDSLKEKILVLADDGNIPETFLTELFKTFKLAGLTKTDTKKIFLIFRKAMDGFKIEEETKEVMQSLFSIITK